MDVKKQMMSLKAHSLTFNDIEAKRVLLSHGVGRVTKYDDDGETPLDGAITINDLRKLTDEDNVPSWFNDNYKVTNFDELVYTNVRSITKGFTVSSVNDYDIPTKEPLKINLKNALINIDRINYCMSYTENDTFYFLPNIKDYYKEKGYRCNIYGQDMRFDFGKNFNFFNTATITVNRGDVECVIARSKNAVFIGRWVDRLIGMPKYTRYLFLEQDVIDGWGGEVPVDVKAYNIHAIGSDGWQTYMKNYAIGKGYYTLGEDGVTKVADITKIPMRTTEGWDYEYINYLISGVKPPAN